MGKAVHRPQIYTLNLLGDTGRSSKIEEQAHKMAEDTLVGSLFF